MYEFQQSTGEFIDPNRKLMSTGYAGRNENGREGRNNPMMEGCKGYGPLPKGTYKAIAKFDERKPLGKYVIQLMPDDATRVKILQYGRDPDSFFFHGDSNEHPGLASHGCIVQPRATREAFWNGADHYIKVVF